MLRRLIQALSPRKQGDFELRHPAGLAVSRSLTLPALLRSTFGDGLARRDMRNGWVWIRLPAFADGDVVVDMALGFDNDRLEHIALADLDSKHDSDVGSEKEQRRRAASIGNWLTMKGYPPGRYPWGVVSAGYDAKSSSGSASVRLQYKAEFR